MRGAIAIALATLSTVPSVVALANTRVRLRGVKSSVEMGEFLPTGNATASPPAASLQPDFEEVRILHLSDTHNLHRTIEDKFPMPPADILIHSGDFTNFGKDSEFKDANAWLGTLQARYKHIIAITGNHDWIYPVRLPAAYHPEYWQRRLSSATLLLQGNMTVMGINIWGSAWKGGQQGMNPQGVGEMPDGVDIMVTHGPPAGVFDWTGAGHWGGSQALNSQAALHHPKVHLFGHVHEQRGVWQRASMSDKYIGGVEYEVHPGSGHPFATAGPPPDDYPTLLLSNNAMMNLPAKEDWCPARIDGPARLIIAQKISGAWQFRT